MLHFHTIYKVRRFFFQNIKTLFRCAIVANVVVATTRQRISPIGERERRRSARLCRMSTVQVTVIDGYCCCKTRYNNGG